MRDELAIDVRQYAAVAVVGKFFGGIDAAHNGHILDDAVRAVYAKSQLLARL
jgi:hypothetical protein